MSNERLRILETSWDLAAEGYDNYFAPRFLPFIEESIAIFQTLVTQLPIGKIVAPCCGPGRELLLLSSVYPKHPICGVDLSSEMISLALRRTSENSLISAIKGDATQLSSRFQNVALVASFFGLQQLPNPAQGVSDWVSCLSLGGYMLALFWPTKADDGSTAHLGPFSLVQSLLKERISRPTPVWEASLLQSIEQQNGTVIYDRLITKPIHHNNAETFWNAMTFSGPMRALRIELGDAFVDSLKQSFIEKFPQGPIEHTPAARLIIAKKQ